MRRNPASTLVIPIALALVAGIVAPATAAEIVDRFVCKYSGIEQTFTEDADRVLVRFDEASSLGSRQAAARAAGLVEIHSSDNAVDVGVFRATGALDARTASNRMLASDAVVDAHPLLVDQDGFPQYTIAGRMTVQFMPGLDDASCREVIADFGSTVVKDNWTPGYYTISLPPAAGLYASIRAMNANDLVWFAEESMMGFDDFAFVPNDPSYNSQWHLNNLGQRGGTVGADIRAEEAWDVTQGDADTVIVIIDTGVDQDHPDLVNKLYPRNGEDWNFADGPGTNPDDTSGHGTSCAGLAAAQTDNGIGVAGTCPECRIMGLRINLSSGQNDNRADAINYAVQFQNDHPELRLVLSNSWRMSSGSFAAVEAACQNAFDNDVPVLVASGNGNGGIDFPAKYSTTIAIGASSPCDERKNPGSCDGESWGSNYGPEQEVVAPGVHMTTTSIGGGYTDFFNGTSSACPTAAGVYGLVLSLNPALDLASLKDVVASSADDQVGPAAEDPPGWDPWMGWGRINAEEAVLNTPGLEPPTLLSATPGWGRVNTSTTVTLSGTDFFGTPEVDFGGVPAAFVTRQDSETLVVGAPDFPTLETVDITVTTGTGSATLPSAFEYAAVLFAPDTAEPGDTLNILAYGPDSSDFGVVFDYFLGSKVKRGLTFPIDFTPGVWGIAHDSFRTGDSPLASSGQGLARYTVPDSPKLPGNTVYFVGVFDANGTESGRELALGYELDSTTIE